METICEKHLESNLENTSQNEFFLDGDNVEIELRLARLESLHERKSALISLVAIKQNPHNVNEWLKRVQIFDGDKPMQITTYCEAIATVDPTKAKGKPHLLWCEFAKFYEKDFDLDNARIVFEKAISQHFIVLDDLAHVYCEWVEMELRNGNFKRGLYIVHRVLKNTEKNRVICLANKKMRNALHEHISTSPKLWNLLCDLEESTGKLDSTRTVYYRMMEIGVSSPQNIINFAAFLNKNNYFEEAFQVYERGVNLFRFPQSKDIWLTYLDQFVLRYKGSKLERTRDLFQQALNSVPAEECLLIYIKYAEVEETCGFISRAMQIYRRAVKSVPIEQRLTIYHLYITKAQKYLDISKVRELFETAIEAQEPCQLMDKHIKEICLRFAKLELRLGEIDRVRSIFIYASQFVSEAEDKILWDEWNQFEVKHGSEETFRDMLRLKRSVVASSVITNIPKTCAKSES
jgi:pre-mRNA-splicing factor SYF1